MRRLRKRFLIPVILILPLFARADDFAFRTISASQWHALTNDKSFSYKNQVETAPARSHDTSLIQALLRGFWAFFSSGLGSFLLWTLVICAILFITYRLFLSNDSFLFGRDKQKMNGDTPQNEDEQDITATNWEQLLQKAMHEKDLRLAVRYSYMWLLQMLQHKELIQYRPNKTNYEYYSELRDTKYKQAFKDLSRKYEYTWYGKFMISPDAYNEFTEAFNGVRKQLGA